jgi:hypothetical protein
MTRMGADFFESARFANVIDVSFASAATDPGPRSTAILQLHQDAAGFIRVHPRNPRPKFFSRIPNP